MIQRIFALLIAVLGAWIYDRYDTVFAIVPIVIALSMYKGASEGVWFYWDFGEHSESDSDSSSSDGEN